MTTVGELAQVLDARGLLVRLLGSPDDGIEGASQDSRTTRPGDVFLAWKGTDRDAHDFAGQAQERGAVAAVVERELETLTIPQLVVSDGRAAAAFAADHVVGSPFTGLFGVAVTGTNGKTTTALLTRWLLSRLGRSGSIGTLGVVGFEGEVRPGTEGLTTPGPVQLMEWIDALAREGAKSLVLEASSHALDQRRLDALSLDVAVFTNVGRDHLDYHGTREAYVAAKRRLVELLGSGGVSVALADEPAWQDLPGRVVTYSSTLDAEIRAVDIEAGPERTRFTIRHAGASADVALPLIGDFNVENALAATGAGLAAGMGLDQIAGALDDAPQIPGRLERVVDGSFQVVVDFAHTPDALEKALRTLRPLVEGRLIVVFGAGGDRDATKRPVMGRVATELGDIAIVTSDNPRTEDPEAIIDDVVAGITGSHYHREADRRAAIAQALNQARPGDLVLLAGKGHERYQVLGTEKVSFDEPAIVRRLIQGQSGKGS